MASTRRICTNCGDRFRVDNQSRRLKCESCSPPRPARGKRPPAVVVLGPPARVEPALVAALRVELAERADSADGLVALAIAEAITAGGHTASGLAALQKAYGEAKKRALAGVGAQSAGAQVIELLDRLGR